MLQTAFSMGYLGLRSGGWTLGGTAELLGVIKMSSLDCRGDSEGKQAFVKPLDTLHTLSIGFFTSVTINLQTKEEK